MEGVQITYTITSTRGSYDMLYTTVDYHFNGEIVKDIEISHFRPQSQAEVEQSVINRGITEFERLQSMKNIEQIVNNLETNVEKPIE